MTKTEIALEKKVSKTDCKDKHESLEKMIDLKIQALEKLLIEKLKGVTWFNWVHLLGYISIIATLIGIFLKLK